MKFTDDAGNKGDNKEEKSGRTVILTRLPLTISHAELEQRFPIAQEIKLFPKESQPFALVRLSTVEEAVAMASQAVVVVGGHIISVDMTGKKKKEKKASSKASEQRGDSAEPPSKGTVFISPLPLTTLKADLQKHFPTAVRITLRKGLSHAYAFADFQTQAEAQAAAAPRAVELNGRTVRVCLKGDKVSGDVHKEEQRHRTVHVGGLPLTTSQAKLQERFPTAESVKVFKGKMQAFAFVVFSTTEEAQGVASQGKLEGGAVLTMAGDREALEKGREEEQRRTVYISGLPLTTSQTELKQHFPTAQSINLGQGKLQAYAFAVFPSTKEAQSVASRATMELGGHVVALSLRDEKKVTAKQKEEQDSRTLFLGSLPLTIRHADVEQCFPTAEAVKLHAKKTHAFAFVCLPTVEEAVAAASQTEVVVGGHSVPLRMAVGEQPALKRQTDAVPGEAKRRK